MTDTVFKQQAEPVKPEKTPEMKDDKAISADKKVEPPFTSYRQVEGKPYTVEHFELGDYWNDPEGGFEEEIGQIEGYLKGKIERGEIADSVQAVKNELKQMMKINKLKDEQRTVVKMGTLAAYAKFLSETDNIKKTYMKYGH